WFPLECESVEIVRELLSMGQCVGRTYAAPTRVTRSMKSAMNDRRLFTDVFHDVDLAAVGPMDSIEVVTQHPKCRPNSLPVRDLNSRLKPSVRLAELILGEQSCGSVVANYLVRPGEIFLERLDYEQATIEMGVFRSEEHTSELQSRFDLVCRLLLEK